MSDNHCDNCGEFGDTDAHAEECPIILRAEIARLSAIAKPINASARTVHDLMMAPAVRAGTHAIEFRDFRGVVGYLRPRATGWDVAYPRYGAEFLPDEKAWAESLGRWRVTWHDLDAPGRLVAIDAVHDEQALSMLAERIGGGS